MGIIGLILLVFSAGFLFSIFIGIPDYFIVFNIKKFIAQVFSTHYFEHALNATYSLLTIGTHHDKMYVKITIYYTGIIAMGKILLKYLIGILIIIAGLNVHMSFAITADNVARPDFDKIDAYIEKEMKQCRIPGFALGVVRSDEIIYLKGYGNADASDREVTPQTPFLVGSLSKSFTALAVMQLVDEQKLELDKPIKTYIPWFEISDSKASSSITVRQLLNHTSGIATNAEFEVATLRGDDTTIEEIVRKMSKLKLTEEVGKVFQYNNANYIILGEVIQRVSGLSYEDYMVQKVFKPLGMDHSYVSTDAAEKDGMAVGYRTVFGYPVPAELPYRKDFLPAYSIISSSEDVSKYLISLLNRGKYGNTQILTEYSVSEMMKPSSKISNWESYGLGWYVTSGSVYHGGDLPNFQSKAKLLTEDGLGVVLMYNTSSSTLTTLFKSGYRDRIESGIISILYGYEPDIIQPGAGVFDLNRYPMSVTYILYLILCILIVLLLVLSAIRLRSFKKRLVTIKKNLWIRLMISVFIHFALPICILFYVPKVSHAPWSHMLYYIPDVGYLSLLMCIMLLGIGLVKLFFYLQYNHLKNNQKNKINTL